MSVPMIAAAVSVLMVVMVTICSCGDQLSFQISFHSLVCITFCSCHQLDSRIRERLLSASADSAADQNVHSPVRKQSRKRAVSDTVRTDHFAAYL